MSMVETEISCPLEKVQSELIRHVSLEILYGSILNSVQEGVHVIGLNGRILLENEAAIRLLGWQGDNLVGKAGHATIHHHHADHSEYHIQDCPIHQTLNDGVPRYVEEDVFWRKDGQSFPVEYNTAPLRDNEGRLFGVTVVFRDITERKESKARLLRMAQYCLLTNLPNRTLFAERFAQTLSKAQQTFQRFAVMFIDLDQFKPVNDTYGHAVGDLLLCEVAQRIQSCLRPSDTVGRIGGDEFIALITNLTEQACEEVLLVGQRICHTLNQPFQIASFTLHISSSIGIAIYPDHGSDELMLSQNADHAMYLVKQNGRNGVRIFSESC